MKVAALILAAGSARRFGTDKRGLRVNDEQTLLQYTVARYLAVFAPCLVVLREGDAIPARWQSLDHLRLVWQDDPHAGMGDNLALGVRHLQSQDIDAIAVALADMPLVRPDSLSLLERRATASEIIVPCHHDRRGHPVVFGRDFFDSLMLMSGDVGARKLLAEHAPQVRELQLDDAGVIEDVDTPADWRRVKSSLA